MSIGLIDTFNCSIIIITSGKFNFVVREKKYIKAHKNIIFI
jgi:hypothetical protein